MNTAAATSPNGLTIADFDHVSHVRIGKGKAEWSVTGRDSLALLVNSQKNGRVTSRRLGMDDLDRLEITCTVAESAEAFRADRDAREAKRAAAAERAAYRELSTSPNYGAGLEGLKLTAVPRGYGAMVSRSGRMGKFDTITATAAQRVEGPITDYSTGAELTEAEVAELIAAEASAVEVAAANAGARKVMTRDEEAAAVNWLAKELARINGWGAAHLVIGAGGKVEAVIARKRDADAIVRAHGSVYSRTIETVAL
jgi:hypothetical protein